MITQYIIVCRDVMPPMFVRAGKVFGHTKILNNAKHFNSEWAAINFLKKAKDPALYQITQIRHQ